MLEFWFDFASTYSYPAAMRIAPLAAAAEVEVRQFAHAFFLERQLFRTKRRLGILILVARFEHRVEVCADIGYDGRIAPAEWGSLIAPMVPLLREAAPTTRSSPGSTRSAPCWRRAASPTAGRTTSTSPDALRTSIAR